jgi:hypothetical protein
VTWTVRLRRGTTTSGTLVATATATGSVASDNTTVSLEGFDALGAIAGQYVITVQGSAGNGTITHYQCTALEVGGAPGPAGVAGPAGPAGADGATTLDGLTDVVISTPATNQVLAYNGSIWANATPTGGGGGGVGTYVAPSVGTTPVTTALAAAIVSNAKVVLEPFGTYWLDAEIVKSGLSNVEIVGNGATIKLTASAAWGTTYKSALTFKQCSNIDIHDLTLHNNGAALLALNAACPCHGMITFTSPTADGNDFTFYNSNCRVRRCIFEEVVGNGILARKTSSLTVTDNICRNAQPSTATGGFAMQSGLLAFHKCKGVVFSQNKVSPSANANIFSFAMCGSPGAANETDVYSPDPAMNSIGMSSYDAPILQTAPSSGTTWVLDLSGRPVYPAVGAEIDGGLFSARTLYMQCYDKGAGLFIYPEQIVVGAYNNTAKTISLTLKPQDAATANWSGQKFYVQTIDLSRFNHDVSFSGNEVDSCIGACVLFGTRHIEISNNRVRNCRDIGLDIEWCMDAVFEGNVVYNGTVNNSAIAVLFFARNVIVANNVQVLASGATASTVALDNNGQVNDNILITNNRGYSRIHVGEGGGSDTKIYTNLHIVGNSCAAIALNSAAAQVSFFDTLIADNYIHNLTLPGAYDPIAIMAADGVVVRGNIIAGFRYYGVLLESGGTNLSRRVVVENNIHGDYGDGQPYFPLVASLGANVAGWFSMGAQANLGRNMVAPTHYRHTGSGTAARPRGLPYLSLGTMLLRDNAGVLEKSTTAEQEADAAGSWTAVGGGLAAGATIPQHKLTDQTAKTGAYSLVAADSGTRIPYSSGTVTVTVPAAGTLGNGFSCEVINAGSGSITIDGPGGTNLALAQHEAAYIFVTGGVLYAAEATYTAL